jgi:hypothetical protein
MRNEFVTPFWKNALASLPESVRPRYELQLHAAERWELALGTVIEAFSQISRVFGRPSGAH